MTKSVTPSTIERILERGLAWYAPLRSRASDDLLLPWLDAALEYHLMRDRIEAADKLDKAFIELGAAARHGSPAQHGLPYSYQTARQDH